MKTKFFLSEGVKPSWLLFFKPNLLLLVLVSCILIRCSDDNGDNVKPDKLSPQEISIKDLSDFLAAAYGLPVSEIKYRDDADGQYFVIEGDLLMKKETAEYYYREVAENSQGRTEQRRLANLVNQTTVTDVRVRITANVPNDWAQATRTAMANWNAITGTRLTFREVTSGEHIQIFVGPIADPNVIAEAPGPSAGGLPGSFVRIDDGHLGEPSKIFTMAHELGHTIGLSHTNTSEGSFIVGTPVSDPQSVMNAFVLPWNGFTQGDRAAVQILYPLGPVTGNLYIIQGAALVKASQTTGDWQVLGAGNEWQGTNVMTSVGGYLYMVQGGALVRANPSNGAWTVLGDGTEWSGTNELTSYNGYLYMVQGSALVRADPGNGAWTVLGDGTEWSGSTAMTSCNGNLYIIQGAALVRADPGNGAWTVLGNGTEWSGTNLMTSVGGYLYMIQGAALVRADPGNGSWTVLGNGTEWAGTTALTSYNGSLYMVQGGALVMANPNNGAWTVLGDGTEWNGTTTMTSN